MKYYKQSQRVLERIRVKYAQKRRTEKWKKRKLHKKNVARIKIVKRKVQAEKPFTDHIAPKNFSLIENTNEVLGYFHDVAVKFGNGDNINFDISEVDNLTSPTIALLVATINNLDIRGDSIYRGNAPQKEELKELFLNSGFYKFVRSISPGLKTSQSGGHILHKEMNTVVVGEIAKNAVITGVKHTYKADKSFEPLYEILIECMANTNNHANLDRKDKCKWWLYVYTNPNNNITAYSFLDLGVGIFESKVVKTYIQQFLKGLFPGNLNMVDSLLDGTMQSRIDEDNEIRGKGIPQIVNYSKLKEFKCFYIITNDVKIDLKSGERVKLSNALKGTFLYWELQ